MTATAATAAPRRSRRLLLPLATLVAATGIALASGASFTTTTASAGVVASGTLKQTNTNDVAFSKDNLKPGDVVTGSVTITNNGTLPAIFKVTETGTNGFSAGIVSLQIVETGPAGAVTIYSGELSKAGEKALGEFAVNESRTYAYTVTVGDAGNADQGKTASTLYTFDSVQKSGETFSSVPGKSVSSPS